jgi:hypothetical protein
VSPSNRSPHRYRRISSAYILAYLASVCLTIHTSKAQGERGGEDADSALQLEQVKPRAMTMGHPPGSQLCHILVCGLIPSLP